MERHAKHLQIEDFLKQKLTSLGYTEMENLNSDPLFAAAKANDLSFDEVAEKLCVELSTKLNYLKAHNFSLNVYRDDQFKWPRFGYYAKCYYS